MKHAHPFKMIVGKTSSVLLTFFFLCQQTWFFKCILQGFIFEAAIFVSRSQMGWCGETEFQGEGVGYACRSKKRLNRQVIKFPNLWKEKNSLQIFKKSKISPIFQMNDAVEYRPSHRLQFLLTGYPDLMVIEDSQSFNGFSFTVKLQQTRQSLWARCTDRAKESKKKTGKMAESVAKKWWTHVWHQRPWTWWRTGRCVQSRAAEI